ncbi:hypothetical protein Bca52824_066121 [Brassica carinata]|uniref:KIB1-4 beta-propeller domain-containing protein n=1 Tax=Brassica carinata TaxID=52824 RepID=A0A8X7UD26_BRACI|nr:hypothetical protein Bca52824_066121 [Brassica carinata]
MLHIYIRTCYKNILKHNIFYNPYQNLLMHISNHLDPYHLNTSTSTKPNRTYPFSTISDPSFSSSHVMYSKRDEMFSMPSSRGHYTRSWDLGRHMKEPKLQMLMQPPEDQIPRMTKRAWQRLESCCTKQHYLVESSHTDETFMLKWYTQSRPTLNVWDHFLLLKIDKEGNALYTKDIGDLCILLSRSEPICIPAKLNRRAKNCIYMLTEHEFAIVGIGSFQKFCRTPFTCSLPYYISKN